MTKIILSTGNIVSGGPSIIRKPGAYRSNLELTNSLRSNFLAAQQGAAAELEAAAETGADTNGHAKPAVNGNGHAAGNGTAAGLGNGYATTGTLNGYATTTTTATTSRRPPLAAWTQREESTLYVPRVDWPTGQPASCDCETETCGYNGLQEEASQYETTVKLFFLPNAPVAERAKYAQEALSLVLRELGGAADDATNGDATAATNGNRINSIDLLVISFPGMSFDGDCEWEADKINSAQGNDDDEVATWKATAEALHAQGRVRRLGVAEFGSAKLGRFVERVAVKPDVDQINVRNCCNVPPPLTELAKEKGIELLVHTDCTDILPPGTLRELLGQGLQGAGVLVSDDDRKTAEQEQAAAAVVGGVNGDTEGVATTTVPADALRGDLTPQWVAKYTAIVRDRGVIENKGYFAGAELKDE